MIPKSTPSRSQRSKLPVRYSFWSRLRLHHQGGSTPFVHEACKAVHKEAESIALLHNTLPQAVKSDRALLNNSKTTKAHCTMSPSKIEVTMACTLGVANRMNVLCPE